MLSSDRSVNPYADDEDDAAMWERLRTQAAGESQVAADPTSDPRHSGFRPATRTQGEPEYSHYETDGAADPYAQYAQHAQHAEQEHYTDYSEEQAPSDEYADELSEDGQAYTQEQHDAYAQQQQDIAYAQQQYDYVQQQQALQAQAQQTEYQQAQAQPLHFGQPSGFGQLAAYGHVEPAQQASAFEQQAWAAQSAAHTAAPAFVADHEAPQLRSRWMTTTIFGLIAVLAVGGAGYQFVWLPKQQHERAAALVELQAAQQKLIDEQKVADEAKARAEAEQKVATEAALARADEAAAAAAGPAEVAPGVSTKAGKKAVAAPSESKSEKKARERAERHERRAAKSKGSSHERSAKSAAPVEKAEKAAPAAKKSKKSGGGAMAETDNNDPLFGL